ncbi:MAG TPA: glutamate formimidoyltransferase [Anaerolineales bacterium]
MPSPLVECIPNFSEGRRPEVLEALELAIRSVPGVLLLDRHTDADHNRSVFTFAGPPPAVAEAAFRSIRRAAELIDLERHRGEHPRIGAADVVPFVPLQEISTEECVQLARDLGRRVGDELGIPVYLYEAAATRPERVRLENLRRGEYEGLKDSIARDPDRAPDFGPAVIGPAGATVIGARAPLIAFNAYLETADVAVAKEIAREIRESSGGLPAVKALGLMVDGRAQVSMNLTEITRTSIPTVVERIQELAQARGTSILRCEIVGLVPQAALLEAARVYLHLSPFSLDQILETRLMDAHTRESSEPAFLAELAAATPTPGGGSAAAYAAAMAGALVAMVARLTLGKKKYADVQDRMEALAREADEARRLMEAAVKDDARAFEDVLAARRMTRRTPEEERARDEAIETATGRAAAVPLLVARHATQLLEWAAEVVESGNVNAAADGASAGALARAALRAASLNVRANAQALRDASVVVPWLQELASLERRAEQAETRVAQALASRAQLSG